MFVPRHAQAADSVAIFELYQRVAAQGGGIARTASEITPSYVEHFMQGVALHRGVELVLDHPTVEQRIIAEIHCYQLSPKVFGHLLSELTVVVDAEFQGQGLGRLLFEYLLNYIRQYRSDILRVELIARESNTKAIALYRSLGFVVEGRLERRIGSEAGGFEADIPLAWFNEAYQASNSSL